MILGIILFFASLLREEGNSIIPNVNLVKNIGFRKDATHTKSKNEVLSNIKILSIGKIIHPLKIEQNKILDKYTSDNNI